MNKVFLFIALLFATSSMAMGQETASSDSASIEKRIKEVQDFKMKYLAQKMDLSEKEKKQFFEVYTQMCEEKAACYSEAIQMQRKIRHDKNASEEECEQANKAMSNANSQWAEKEKQFDERFSEFLSQRQIYKMKMAESEFKARYDEMKLNRRKGYHQKQRDKSELK